MKRETILLKLISDDLRALHLSAITLENDLGRLAREIDSQELRPLTHAITQINSAGYAPLERTLREAGLPSTPAAVESPSSAHSVLAEVSESADLARKRRIGSAQAISIMRRAARYMELYCASVADAAARMHLETIAQHLRAWGREWIGLELKLNTVVSRRTNFTSHGKRLETAMPYEREEAFVAA